MIDIPSRYWMPPPIPPGMSNVETFLREPVAREGGIEDAGKDSPFQVWTISLSHWHLRSNGMLF